jgi:hypothetical protein
VCAGQGAHGNDQEPRDAPTFPNTVDAFRCQRRADPGSPPPPPPHPVALLSSLLIPRFSVSPGQRERPRLLLGPGEPRPSPLRPLQRKVRPHPHRLGATRSDSERLRAQTEWSRRPRPAGGMKPSPRSPFAIRWAAHAARARKRIGRARHVRGTVGVEADPPPQLPAAIKQPQAPWSIARNVLPAGPARPARYGQPVPGNVRPHARTHQFSPPLLPSLSPPPPSRPSPFSSALTLKGCLATCVHDDTAAIYERILSLRLVTP